MSNTPITDDSLGLVLKGFVSVVGTLAASVAMLWKTSEAKNAKSIEQLQTRLDQAEKHAKEIDKSRIECEQDRSTLNERCTHLNERISRLESQQVGK